MSQTREIAKALDFEWSVFNQQQKILGLELHHPPSDDAHSPENMLFNAYSNLEKTFTPPAPQDTEERQITTSETPSESDTSSPKNASTPYSKRRYQNRAAQRAFRARQKQHTDALESKLDSVFSELEKLQKQYTTLHIAYQNLLVEKMVPDSRCESETSDSLIFSDGELFGDFQLMEGYGDQMLSEPTNFFFGVDDPKR